MRIGITVGLLALALVATGSMLVTIARAQGNVGSRVEKNSDRIADMEGRVKSLEKFQDQYGAAKIGDRMVAMEVKIDYLSELVSKLVWLSVVTVLGICGFLGERLYRVLGERPPPHHHLPEDA